MSIESNRKIELRGKGPSGRAGVLRLENISKVFPSHDGGTPVAAVDDISLNIDPGQMVTLLGPSGCGKTTTLRIIAGFEQPTFGRVMLEDRDITFVSANKRNMGMVFQSYALFPHLSVYENVAYGLKVKRLDKKNIQERVKQAVDLTQLTGFENRQPSQLSGGQQQRVALARAMVIEPNVLLFDEPLSNLDAKLREQMRDELRRIQTGLGLTGVYVTHDQSEAMTISDLVVVMNKGKIEQAGPPAEIYRQPASRFVSEFIGKASFLPGMVEGTVSKGLQISALGCSWQVGNFAATLKKGDNAELVIRPEGVKIGQPGEFKLEGRISSLIYQGPQTEYEIVLGSGQHLLAVLPTLGQNWLPKNGDEVSVELIETALAAIKV